MHRATRLSASGGSILYKAGFRALGTVANWRDLSATLNAACPADLKPYLSFRRDIVGIWGAMARATLGHAAELEKLQLVLHSWALTIEPGKYINDLLVGINDFATEVTLLLSALSNGGQHELEEEPEVVMGRDTNAKYEELMKRYTHYKDIVARIKGTGKTLKRQASDGADDVKSEVQPIMEGDVSDEQATANEPKRSRSWASTPPTAEHEASDRLLAKPQ
jgi:hypothetical protein